ncbi:hypothetical protein PQX77_009273 [Marasmius sp. AFHP31]|nr:hypothetical protein PQX77_009273 [Marasmius sp. AFHP31]
MPSPYFNIQQTQGGPIQPAVASQYARERHSSASTLQPDSPYTAMSSSRSSPAASERLRDKFKLSPDPRSWGVDLNDKNLDEGRDHKKGRLNARALSNIGCLAVLVIGVLALFAGYPIYAFIHNKAMSKRGGFDLGGINASGQVPEMPGQRGLIDVDTPPEAYTITSFHDKTTQLQLVFSDEFNQEGRTFYPGDDPYWEAVDLHYWGTNNMEWYDPAGLITENGSLKITLSATLNHDKDYMGGMMSTWNKFCFTGGLIVANIMLPGRSDVVGLWPGVWTMGNLGRAGYGATNHGTWPYSYDSCDVGTLPNQTLNGLPYLATTGNDQQFGGALSYLPGQRLSRCTCPGEPHPGPVHSDGTYVGRSAPEIDMIEAQVGHNFVAPGSSTLVGEVSQSGQWAPFNYKYEWFDGPGNFTIDDPTITELNSYRGGALQQAVSYQQCYSQIPDPCFTIYGFEYKPGYDDSYISWINDGKKVCTVMGKGLGADPRVEISDRPVPQEPMVCLVPTPITRGDLTWTIPTSDLKYIITNVGMSRNFGDVDLEHLVFPAHMYVDYIRVYQHPDRINIGCDPKEFPTQAYIEEYKEAYTNANLTTWDQYGQQWPKNRLVDQC